MERVHNASATTNTGAESGQYTYEVAEIMGALYGDGFTALKGGLQQGVGSRFA